MVTIRKLKFLIIPIISLSISVYFFLATLNAAVSKKYEVFNPKETYYFSTLKTEIAKENYINEVEQNNLMIEARLICYFFIAIISLIFPILVLKFKNSKRKIILKS